MSPYDRSIDVRVAVVMASAGRPELVGQALQDLRAQTFDDFRIVLAVPDEASLPPSSYLDAVTVVLGTRGLAAQRNAGLDAIQDATHIFFFDDDAVIRSDYITRSMDYFAHRPDTVAITGRVLLDGATGQSITRETAEAALLTSLSEPLTGRWRSTAELYGCNFAFQPRVAGGERFDERLPLYSWLEDHDFARRVARHGPLAKVYDAVIVHRGAKSGGRMAHEMLGYSQVMNPAYLRRKGSFSTRLALRETVFRVAKNAALSVRGDSRTWRRKRLRGNLMAVGDLLQGHYTPERITSLSNSSPRP